MCHLGKFSLLATNMLDDAMINVHPCRRIEIASIDEEFHLQIKLSAESEQAYSNYRTHSCFHPRHPFIALNPEPYLSLYQCLHGYISGDVLMLISCAEYSPHRTDDGHGIKIFDFYSSPDAGTDSIPFLSATSAGCFCYCLCFAPVWMVPQSNIAYQAVVPLVITYHYRISIKTIEMPAIRGVLLGLMAEIRYLLVIKTDHQNLDKEGPFLLPLNKHENNG